MVLGAFSTFLNVTDGRGDATPSCRAPEDTSRGWDHSLAWSCAVLGLKYAALPSASLPPNVEEIFCVCYHGNLGCVLPLKLMIDFPQPFILSSAYRYLPEAATRVCGLVTVRPPTSQGSVAL